MIQKGYVSVREAATLSGLSRDHISFLLRRGTLKGLKVERDWLVEERALKVYLAKRPKPGPKKGSKRP